MQSVQEVSGHIVDVIRGEVFPGTLKLELGKITGIQRNVSLPADAPVIMPGVVNSHVHIESTKMNPVAAGIALSEAGVLGTISDPHEIGNVCGVDGLRWMLEQGQKSPIDILYGVPSCVPATPFETSGAALDASVVCDLLAQGNFGYLAEVMNWPGVINQDPGLMQMIKKAHELGLPVDGHAPEVRGENFKKYISSGIQTDHESASYEEGLDKLQQGMKLLIREGSAAKNFDALIPLIRQFSDRIMFCTDDSEPHEVKDAQPLALVRRGMQMGYDQFALLRAATANPILHYGLDLGLLQLSDNADFIMVDSLQGLNVLHAYRNGKQIVKDGESTIQYQAPSVINNFHAQPISTEDLKIPASDGKHQVRVIDVVPGQIVTRASEAQLKASGGQLHADPEKDILKLVVLNRYQPDQKSVVVFARNFGIKHGALAASIAHDSHNIIATGSDDQSIAEAINLLVSSKGGVSLVGPGGASVIPLPIAGLMSDQAPDIVASQFARIEERSKELGTTLPSAFMALSFLALLVIPEIKVSDKVGLFDAKEFKPISLFV